MMPLNHILRKFPGRYKLSKLQEKINHLMYMDNIELLAKNLIQKVRIYSQDIEMEFSIEKCAMIVMKSGKRHMTEVIELPNQEKIGTHGEKETLQIILGNIGS